MTTCHYCNLPITDYEMLHAVHYLDFYQHGHAAECASALKRRVAELNMLLLGANAAIADANAAIAYLNDRVAIDREAPVT